LSMSAGSNVTLCAQSLESEATSGTSGSSVGT
jgi:hypothetical protein